jgi:tape measure domain-containing protein
MNVSNGDIRFEMKLEDGGFQITVKDAVRTLKTLQRELNSSAVRVDDLERSIKTSTRGAFRDLLVSVASARYALQDLNDIFIQMPKRIAETTGEFQRLQAMLSGLSDSATEIERIAEAQSGFAEIIRVAKNAPFEIKNLSDAFVKLKIAGLDPASGGLTTLVDGIAKFGGSSENLQRAAVAIQQMTGKGVISMEELRQQLGEAMPNAMRLMARGMGMTMAELTELVSKGSVRAGSALRRMFIQMRIDSEGAAAALMETYPGALSRLQTSFALFQKEVGNAGFIDVLVNQMSKLTESIDSVDGKSLATILGEGLGDAARNIAILVQQIVAFSDQIILLGKAAIVIWTSGKLRSGLSAITAMYQQMIGQVNALQEAERNAKNARIASVNEQINAERRKIASGENELQSEREKILATRESNIARLNAARTYRTEQIRLKREEIASLFALDQKYAADQERIRRAKQRGARQQIDAISVDRGLIAQRLPALERQIQVLQKNQAQLKQYENSLRSVSSAESKSTQSLVSQIETRKKSILSLQATASVYGKLNVATASAALAVGRFGLSLVKSIGFAGAAFLAIEGLVFVWDRVAGAAKRAAEAQERALRINRGEATEEDFKSAESRKSELLNDIKEYENAKKVYEADVEKFSKINPKDSRARIAQTNADAAGLKLRNLREDLAGVTRDFDQAAAARARVRDEDGASKLNDIYERTSRDLSSNSELARELTRLNDEFNIAAKDGKVKDAEALKKQIAAKSLEYLKKSEQVSAQALDETLAKAKGQGFSDEAVKRFKDAVYEKRRNLLADITETQGAPDVGFGKDKDGAGSSEPKTTESNSLEKAIARANAEIDRASVGFKNALTGIKTAEGLRNEVRAKYQTLLEDGFYPDIIEKTVTGKGKNKKTTETKTPVTMGMLQPLMDAEYYREVLQDYEGVADRVREMKARIEADLQIATDRATNNPNNLSEGMRTLERDIAQTNRRMLEFIDFINVLGKESPELAAKLASAGVTEAAIRERMMADAAALRTGQRAIDANSFVAENRDETRALVDSLGTQSEQRKTYWDREIERTRLAYQKILNATEENSAERQRVEEQLASRMSALDELRRREMQGAFGAMLREWGDVRTQIDQAATNWGSGFIDMMVEGMTGGGYKIKDYLISVLKDALRINLQSDFKNLVGDVIGTLQKGFLQTFSGDVPSVLKGLFGGDKSSEAQSKQTEVVNSVTETMRKMGLTIDQEVIASLVNQAFAGGTQVSAAASVTASFVSVTAAAYALTTALQSAAAASGAQGVADGWFDEAGGISDWFDFGSKGVDGWADAAGSAADWFKFANGGIMSSGGSLALKKYAAGGIANSPQLALFGEGRMNEAFVPLPDGRSIPVTMSGNAGSGDQVTIQINVSDSSDSVTSSGKSAQNYLQMAERVKGVVREELMKQKRPGGMLYG